MKKIFSLLFAIFPSSFLFSQEKHIINVDFLMPGISTEHRIIRNNTISSQISLNVPWGIGLGNKYLALNPYVTFRYNHYLNLSKRASRNASITRNSGNYITVGLNFSMNAGLEVINTSGNSSNKGKSWITIPFGFGIQRTISNKMYYNLLIGGALVPYQTYPLVPMINFRLGYNIFNVK